MKKTETHYSNRIIFPVAGCILFLLFTVLYTFEIYTKGCFIYSKTLGSSMFDLFVCAFSFIPFFVMTQKVYRYYVKLIITDTVIQVKRPLGKPSLIDKGNLCLTSEKGKYSKEFPNRYFIITDKRNPENKIIVSEYFIRNYKEIRNSLSLDIVVE